MVRIEEELANRKLPDFMDESITTEAGWEEQRKRLKKILHDSLYGNMPFLEHRTQFQIVEKDMSGYGGRAVLYHVLATVTVYGSPVSFPFQIALPLAFRPGAAHGEKAVKGTFLYLGFTPVIGDGMGEFILDRGYGIIHVFYQDMAADYPDGFQSGLGRLGIRNSYHSAGKLAIWAFGLCRIMDYIEETSLVDTRSIAVMGHSRLGKTALIAGAFDERFLLTVALQSGAGGVALFRGKGGEQLSDLYREPSREWLSPKAYEYMDDIEKLPFDQHFLVALAAPRRLFIGSALEDLWADPLSEYLSCAAGGEAYRFLGHKGLVRRKETEAIVFRKEKRKEDTNYPWGIVGESTDGEIGWYCRYGTHYLSILDWEQIIKYREIHKV